MGVLSSIGSAFSSGFSPILAGVTDAWNLAKDIFNVDRHRDQTLAQNLQGSQYDYNLALQENSQSFQQKLASIMQGYNNQNMDKQFMYNDFLSNSARQVLQSRLAGKNIDNTSSAGSVSALAAPSPATGISQIGGNTYNGGSRQVLATNASQTYKNIADAQNTQEDTETKRINNITLLQKNLAELLKLRSEAYAAVQRGGKDAAEAYAMLSRLDSEIKENEAHIDFLRKSGQAAVTTANAASQNAQTASMEQKETARHNRVNEAIARDANRINEKSVDNTAKTINATIDKLTSEANKNNADAGLTKERAKYYAEEIMSQIELNESQKKLVDERAAKEHVEAKYAERRLKAEIALTWMRSVESGSKSISNVCDALESIAGAADKVVGIAGKAAFLP